jgi:hypothetical protein
VNIRFAYLQRREGKVVKRKNLLAAEVLQRNTSAGRKDQQLDTLEGVFHQVGTLERLLQQLVQRGATVSRYILFLYQGLIGCE